MIRTLVLVAAGLAVYLAFAVAVGRYLRARNEATPRSNAADVAGDLLTDVRSRSVVDAEGRRYGPNWAEIDAALERIAEEWSNE